jgi:signal transduction histidine kinase
MTFQWNPLILLVFPSVALLLLLLGTALWRRQDRLARLFAVFAAVLLLWALAYAGEMAAADVATLWFWLRIQYLAVVATAPLWLLIILRYSGRPAPPALLLVAPPGLAYLGMVTNEAHHLFYTSLDLGRYPKGPFFWALVAICYSYLLVALGLLVVDLGRAAPAHRPWLAVLLAATLAPFAGNLAYVAAGAPGGFDPTPNLLALSAILLGLALARGRLLQARPVALRTALAAVPDAILVADAAGNLVELNAAARHLLGEPAPAQLAAALAALGLTAGEAERLVGATPDVVRVRAAARVLEARSAPVVEHQRAAGLVIVVRDVTDAERHEAERRQTQAQVAQAGKLAAIGTLAAGVAHELNQPLMVIRGQTQLLLASGDDPRRRQAKLAIIERQTEKMAAIIDHLRAFGRAEPPEPAVPVDLDQVCQAALLLIGAQLRERGIMLRLELAGAAGDGAPLALADANQVEQIVLNLLINARDAIGRDGEVQVHTWTAAGQCGLSIADTGPGIPPEVQPHLFEPFFTTKPVGQGTGLGLSISREIALRWGGALTLANRSDRPGAVATLILPAAPDHRRAQDGASTSPTSAHSNSDHRHVRDGTAA